MVNALARTAALLLVAMGIGFPLVASSRVAEAPAAKPARMSLARLCSRGALRMAAVPDRTSYYLDHGRPAGFHYELLREFADRLGVRLESHPVSSVDAAVSLLASGRADIVVLPPGTPPAAKVFRAKAAFQGSRQPPPDVSRIGPVLVRHDSPELLAQLDFHYERSSRDGLARILYYRFLHPELPRETALGVGISDFDSLIARHAMAHGVDWRLVAAVISEESGFDPDAVSRRGATGLMQLMPDLSERSNVRNPRDPEANVAAGVRYLRRLMDMFGGAKGESKLPIVLAAYLLGPGHVFDARQLAVDRGADPETWSGGVKESLLLLEDPRHFERTRFGYANGRLAVRYAERVLERYQLYRHHAAGELSAMAPAASRNM